MHSRENCRQSCSYPDSEKLNFSEVENEAAINHPKLMEEFVAMTAIKTATTKGRIIPVDFQNSGFMELNKKWGGGLQQMLER